MVFLWLYRIKLYHYNPGLPEGIYNGWKDTGPMSVSSPSTRIHRNPPKNPPRTGSAALRAGHHWSSWTPRNAGVEPTWERHPGWLVVGLVIFWGDWIITSHKTWGWFSCVQWLNGIKWTLNQQTSSNLWLVEMTFTSGVSGTKKHWPWTTLNLVSPRRR